MSQPNLPFEIEWLNDGERHHAGMLFTGLIKLCKAREHPLNVLTVERIKHIIITDAQANRLEARLAALLNRPGERIPGAFINAVTTARDRHARAIEGFETAYPAPAPAADLPGEPKSPDTGNPNPRPGHNAKMGEDGPPSEGPEVPVDHTGNADKWAEIRKTSLVSNKAESPEPEKDAIPHASHPSHTSHEPTPLERRKKRETGAREEFAALVC